MQTITVEDTTDPTLSGVPNNTTVECDAIPTAPIIGIGGVTATDNCDTSVTIVFTENIITLACGSTIERTWTATDDCGNETIQTQTITVEDTTDPTLNGVPNNTTVECDAIPTAPIIGIGGVTATDNCDTSVTIVFTENIITLACGSTIERTWTATDDCGNETIQMQTITVEDTTDPTLNGVPNNTTVECDAIPTAPIIGIGGVTASDNCDTSVTIVFIENIITLACGSTIERTWTATDDCGNETIQMQTITVEDTTDPTLNGVPNNTTVECDAIPTAPIIGIGGVTASDNCDTNVTIVFTENIITLACGSTIERTWTATDDCGNETIQMQTITVEDTTDPTLSGVPNNTTVECDAIPTAPIIGIGGITATDNCDTNVTIVFTENIITLACGSTIERTWTATDDCGNETIQMQTITVEDTTDPTLSGVPNNTTVECDAIPTAPIIGIGGVTATDNCDTNVTIVFTENIITLACGSTIERTWTATDDCGNETIQTQTITVEDTTDPTLSGVPNNTTVECDAIPTAPIIGIGGVTASDNCDTNVTIVFTENIITLACGSTIERTWTATDDCGNETIQMQTITVEDTTDPTLSGVPNNTTVECDAIPTAPIIGIGGVTATDNCDTSVTIVFTENIITLACGSTIERTWTATDDCGNETIQTQTITVEDTTDPTLSGVPNNTTVECDAIPTAPIIGIGGVTASDNCDTNVTIVFTENIITLACGSTIERTWTATDDCGNETIQMQTITVEDTTDPTLSGVPNNTTVECDAIPTAPIIGIGGITATDNCDTSVTIVFTENIITLACGSTIERTWTATDDCGNETIQTQTITVEDTTDPTLSGVPNNTTVECDAIPTAPIIGIGGITATDNCDTSVTIVFTENIITLACGSTIERTWTATDDCGNETIQMQTITVEDTTDPTLSGVPNNTTVECDAIPTAPIIGIGGVTATDNCDTSVTIVFTENIITLACGSTIERTWTATDDCGNETIQTQTITVEDTTDPTLSGVPNNTTVECDAIPTAPIIGIGGVTASDNCDTNVTIVFTENIITLACGSTIERTWTATDDCGNETIQMQTITVEDTTDPTLSGVPNNTTVECDAIPTAPIIGIGGITATDNCDTSVTIVFTENIITLACGSTIERTWTATDDCGNETIQTQTITVEDTTDPTLSGVPNNTTVECDAIPTAPIIGIGGITATDNCDTSVTIVFTENIITLACGSTIERTWTATDDCGNETIQMQTITVEDTTDPTLSGVPNNTTVECDAIPTAPIIGIGGITATDNCDTSCHDSIYRKHHHVSLWFHNRANLDSNG